jgi:DNA-binding MarR family transcriptional regulator
MDAFRRIVHALRSSHRAAADLNLTGAQLFVLATLGAVGEPMGVKELAEQTRTDQSTVSVVAGRLVDRGLVKRARSRVDTRRVELSLTARGKMLQQKTPTTVAQQKLADALWQLSASDAGTLSRILKGVVEMMGEADAPAPMLFDENAEEQTKTRHRRSATKKARTRAVRR